GTHVDATGDIALFKIVSESAVSSGVRRIEALTGEAARQWLLARDEALRVIASSVKSSPEEAATRVTALVEERKRLEKELAEARRALALGGGGTGAARSADEDVGGVTFSRMGSGVAAICAVNDGKAAIAVAVTDDLTDRFSAVDLVKIGVETLGGKGGGGRPDMAQGGGPDAGRAQDAIDAIRGAMATATA
ncbi:MAG: alanine--tRNA ligase, partial [Citromicrobium sp.]